MTSEVSNPEVWAAVHAGLVRLAGPFPADVVALAEAHREDVAPRLAAELEALAANPAQADGDYMLHLYAMHLLAWWRDKRGLQPLIALARMPDHDLLEDLLGDHLTESLYRCLASMARGDLPPLMALADDEQADVWARRAALRAMMICVIEGDAQRDTVLAYLRDLGARQAARSRASAATDSFDPDLLTGVVDVAAEMGASDMLPVIREWYRDGLVDRSFISQPTLERLMSVPQEQGLLELLDKGKAYVAHPQREMAWWACFSMRDGKAEHSVSAEAPPPIRPIRQVAPLPNQTYVRESPKLGRNDPCHCGSGKKYKKCHGAV